MSETWHAACATGVLQRRAALHPEYLALLSRADIYLIAMRLIEQHGDGAEVAAILRADPLIQDDESARKAVLRRHRRAAPGWRPIPSALTGFP
jgi:hypothetical protein